MKITAYKCPDTGKIFEHQSAYNGHRRRWLRQQKAAQIRSARLSACHTTLQTLWATAVCTDDIAAWVLSNQTLLEDRHYVMHGPYRRRPTITKNNPHVWQITNLYFDHMQWKPFLRNAHCAPGSQQQNWIGDPDLPLGGPGWYGELHIDTCGYLDGGFRELFEDTGICCLSGSGSKGVSVYEVTLWAADWPGMTTWQSLTENLVCG